MTRKEAAAVVDLLARAYPTYPVDEDLYVEALLRSSHDGQVALAAAASWTAAEPLFPRLSEMLDAVAGEARKRALAAAPRRARAEVARDPSMARAARLIAEVQADLEHGDGYAERVAAEVLRRARDEGLVLPADPAPACPRCIDGSGFVEDLGGLRPCERCRPDVYKRWLGGHFAPGHECVECDAAKRTRASA